jgi:Tfp pilus assembly protein PilO
MESRIISRAAFHLHTLRYKVGRLNILGVIVLTTALLAYLSFCLPQVKRLHAVKAQHTNLTSDQSLAEKKPLPNIAFDADAFLKQFPNVTSKDDTLNTIINLAEKNNLPLNTGKYETLIKESGELVFYQINFPLKGSYPQIRQFLADSLNKLPNASITELLLHHTAVDSNQIEADVSFTLYFNKAT